MISHGDNVANTENREPIEERDDKSQSKGTSSNREESMTESGKDSFSGKSASRNPAPTSQGDGTEDFADNTFIGRVGNQSPASSGTTPLGGESPDQDSITGPGGVEGERDTR